jgi:hypothetical protein
VGTENESVGLNQRLSMVLFQSEVVCAGPLGNCNFERPPLAPLVKQH